MPAHTKRCARPSIGQSTITADFDDIFPNRLVEVVQSLPFSYDSDLISHSSSSQEPPAKRKKASPSPVPSRCIAQGHLSFTRQCSDSKPESLVEGRQDVDTHLSFSLTNSNCPLNRSSNRPSNRHWLRIKSRTTSSLGPLSVEVSILPEHLSAQVAHIIRIGGHSQRNVSPGAIWTHINLSLERYDMVASMRLEFQLIWNETPSPLNGLRVQSHREPSRDLINAFYPIPVRPVAASSPMDFYEAVYVPSVEDPVPLSIEIPGMDAILFPYQKRTLQWLLNREGVQWSVSSGITAWTGETSAPVSESSRVVRDAHGKDMFLNDICHTICANNLGFRRVEVPVRGGILAEEMGLGKTLEILGLILLHKRPSSRMLDNYAGSKLLPSGATLIVTPESLRQQWISEISRHAPGLRYEFYQGCKREGGEGDEVTRRLAQCDVVVTTYGVLSAELHFANDPPERARRQQRRYEHTKSLLVQVSWWRLCLDEAQMIESGFSQAAKVARAIPRINAWGITGTPVKDNVQELFGLLMFLRYEPLCSSPQIWRAVLEQKFVFQKLFNSLALRHTKALVRDQISLPPQRRFTISIPFTAVEEQHYQTIFKDMAEACGVDTQGNPLIEGWDPEDYVEEMRVWLNRLRQSALHPEVGNYSRQLLGSNRARPMRTLGQVLDAMIEQAENIVRTDERAWLSAKLTRGQLLENGPQVKEALAIWEEVRKYTQELVTSSRADLRAVMAEKSSNNLTPQQDNHEEPTSFTSESEEEDDGESKGRVGECRRRLRYALEMQHKAVFFCACAFFQISNNPDMTAPYTDEFQKLKKLEESSYEEASNIRKHILREPHRKATRLMDKILQKALDQTFTEIPELIIADYRGIESDRIVGNLEELYDKLNKQANAIDVWREHLVQLLLKPLMDEVDAAEMTGEELADSTKVQDELMVHVQVLRAVIADRQDAMTGQTNELVKHETQTSIRLAKHYEGPAPNKLLEMMETRDEVKPQSTHISMRGAISELRSLVSRLSNESSQTQRVTAEHTIALRVLQATQSSLGAQAKVAASLESEIEFFTTTMNARLEYYRQLQSLSDGVEPYHGVKLSDEIAKWAKTDEDLSRRLALGQGKLRYLLHLKEAGSESNEPRMCVICQMPFEIGVLTVCGHQFCKECMMIWYKAHRNCPVCKTHLHISQLHDITMKPHELKVIGDGQDSDQRPREDQDGLTKKTVIYSAFNAEQLAEIKGMELAGPSYTTKVDTLIRHLLWLRQSDPGAKSIVFSQYKDFLGILATAFANFRIGFASIDSNGGTSRFKEDSAVEVFLLHARAHASGLNLVNANHVFLCEPLVNTALELQAIARVDRIGQQHETTVWLYVTSGTVEESIYNLSVKRRMEHISKTMLGKGKQSTAELLDAGLEAANTLEMEQAVLSKLMSKDKTAGEVVKNGDLWECLFGHAKRQKDTVRREVVDLTGN